jgi:myosin heavy subunit
VKQLNQSHERFVSDNLQLSTIFGVHHFAGPVLYDASTFVERNTCNLPDFLISVVATTTNGLIAQELGEIMKERSGALKLKKVMRKNAIDVFQIQLKELLSSIEDSDTRYIKCIKPCDDLEIQKKIDHDVFLRQLKCAGLTTAIELSRQMFPNKLSFETVARRYSCLLPTKVMTSIEDMDLIDRAQVILSTVYAPIIGRYQGSTFTMPFACGHSKVFFRTGAMESLEGQRQTLLTTSAEKIQKSVRIHVARRRYLRVCKGFTKLQALHRCHVTLHQYRLSREYVVKVQSRGRSALYRGRFLIIKVAIIFLQRWWIRAKIHLESRRSAYHIKLEAGQIIFRWINGIYLNKQLKIENVSAMSITFWFRARTQRSSFIRKRQAAVTIAAWTRAFFVINRLKTLKKAANAIASHRRIQLATRITKIKKQEEVKTKELQHRSVLKLQLFIRSKQRPRSKNIPFDDANHSPNIIGEGIIVNDLNDGKSLPSVSSSVIDKGRDFVLVPHSVVEQVALYKRQIDELKSDITLLTSEAELHKQEVEAEFEDRLAAYEDEVLQLKLMIESLKEEKITLKDEIAANVENVQNLKTGIQSMHEAHREYLNKVMRAVENANHEHQIALECVKRDKENKIKDLSDEIERLNNERREFCDGNDDNRNNHDVIYHIARKIEKITAPNYVAALAKKVRKIQSQEEYIEEKLSGRVRQYIYKLEDLAASTTNRRSSEDEYIESLQQQLILAKAEIEKMQERLDNSGYNTVSVGRRGIKKFFER